MQVKAMARHETHNRCILCHLPKNSLTRDPTFVPGQYCDQDKSTVT